MRKLPYIIALAGLSLFAGCRNEAPEEVETLLGEEQKNPEPLQIGYGLGIGKFTADELSYAKSVGVDYVEASGMSTFVDGDLNFRMGDAEMREVLEAAKAAADAAGIDIWSVHMPFGAKIDLSVLDEEQRQRVVATQAKLVGFLEILDPEVILFHPSYYLGLNERDHRKSQLIKSATALNEQVQEIGAIMVLENMLGPELLVDSTRERPLMRTVEENVEIFNRLPASIYSAIDMNHIKNPEKLIRAMGSRLKSVHIADGTGEAENHYFPCTGEGQNDWDEILSALEEAGYEGPFMYESSPQDAKEYRECYETLYESYIRDNKISQKEATTGMDSAPAFRFTKRV